MRDDTPAQVNVHMDDLYDAGGAMRRHTPGRAVYQGYITKLGGNKDDPYVRPCCYICCRTFRVTVWCE
jgi:hypothetical protein